MKNKLQNLMKRGTATAVAVACSAWLCGCGKIETRAEEENRLIHNSAALGYECAKAGLSTNDMHELISHAIGEKK